jgi:uncharacterized protein (UPF0276 family)
MSWSAHAGIWLNDLLPLPYTEESVCVIATQRGPRAGRARPPDPGGEPVQLPELRDSTIDEAAFLAELVRRFPALELRVRHAAQKPLVDSLLLGEADAAMLIDDATCRNG